MTNRELFQGIGAELSADVGMMIDLFPDSSPSSVRKSLRLLVTNGWVRWAALETNCLTVSQEGIKAYKDNLI